MAISRTLARLNRRSINPLVRTFAGRLPPLALVVHRGRVSGRAYRTPVLAFPAGDRIIVALVYGAETDWVKNVLAHGGGEMVARGRTVAVTDPELRPAATVAAGVPAPVRVGLRLLRTEQFLVLRRRTGAPEAADAAPNRQRVGLAKEEVSVRSASPTSTS